MQVTPKKKDILKEDSEKSFKKLDWRHNHSNFIWPFKSGKYGKKAKELQIFDYLENETSFFDEIKSISRNFWNILFW